MGKDQSLIQKIKTKSVKIHIGEHTYRMKLLTLALFGIAVVVLLIAIIVLIVVNALSSSTDVDDQTVITSTADPVSTNTQSVELEPEDPVGIPNEDTDPITSPEPTEEVQGTPEPEETPAPSPTSSSDFTETIKSGDSAEVVKVIQQRLVDLYYMDYPVQENGSFSVTSKFGSTTSSAVKLFQERNDISPSGECDAATYAKLISANAEPYIMMQNDKCNMVKVIQTKLKEKGYLDKVTGFCGNDTITAVTNFQKASGLTPDGIAGPGTLKLLLGH